jgi:hypothetical protein
MALNRDALKKRFRDGSRPGQADFKEFIDAGINMADDGIGLLNDGIKLSKRAVYPATGTAFKIEFGDDTINTLEVHHAQSNPATTAPPLLSVSAAGLSVAGITINGTAAMNGRRGNFTQSDVSNPPSHIPKETSPAVADNSWKTILYTRKVCQAFEIVAQLEGSNQSMLVAFATTSESANTDRNTDKQSIFSSVINSVGTFVKKIFGISNTKIRVTQSYSDWLKDSIKIKWVENYNSYSLQVKAESGNIYYAITQLWGADFMPAGK